MFKHEQDKLCVAEFRRLETLIEAHAAEVKKLKAESEALSDDLAAIEQKLDEVLKAQDHAIRSIPDEKAKPEEMSVMPGHVSWSQRKRAREQATRSPNFIDKVKKGAATTEPKPTEEAKNE